MELVHNQMLDLNFLLIGGGVFAGSLLVYKAFKKYAEVNGKIHQLNNEQIHSFNEKNMKQLQNVGKKIVLLKMHCKNTPYFYTQSNVGSLQYFYDQYPLHRNINMMMMDLMFHSQEYRWMSKEFKKPLNFPERCQENIFQINHKYTQKNRGLIQSFFYGAASVIAFIADLILNFITFRQDSAFIGGPTKGILTTTFNLVTDCPLIVECQIQKGIITPKVMGLSKLAIISIYESEKNNQVIQIFILTILAFIFRNKIKRKFINPCWRTIKNVLKTFFSVQLRKKESKLLDIDVQNELLCIICMHRCRNIIFENCKHFSICNECKQEYAGQQLDKCPLCRKQINKQFIFVDQYEQKMMK